MEKKFKCILSSLKNKWYIILLCALVCSGMLYYEKTKIMPVVPVAGEQTFTMLVKFEGPQPILYDGKSDITPLVRTWSFFDSFLRDVEKKYDFQSYANGWAKFTPTNRYGWVDSHFRITPIAANTYELVLNFPVRDAKDRKYVELHGGALLEDYSQHIARIVPSVFEKKEMKVLDRYHLFQNVEVVTANDLGHKYMIIGFVLGGLAAVSVISILSLKNYN